MLRKFFNYIKSVIKEEYKFIIMLFSLYIIFTWPVNYYIIVGGGISDVDSRIEVENSYDSKGSFNISYVTEIEGRVATYLLSYVIPSWELVSYDDYKYDENESLEDIEFRSDLDLKSANGNAVKYAYKLAGKKYSEIDTKVYVVSKFDEYKTSLKIQDQILSINGKEFNSIEEYRNHIQTLNERDIVNIQVKRNKKKINIKSKIYAYEDRKMIGVSLQEVSEYKTEPKVSIKFKESESGPSGGLMTTLDIYNKLTKDDLTKSLKIAGTGTIEKDGSIGTIGGVKYKLIGAVDGGADIFLVPDGENYNTCMEVKKEENLDIEIISVSTIDEAIEKLEKIQ